MVTYISEVIRQFGGRAAGTEQEKKAQEYTAEVLKQFCTSVSIQPFKSHLTSHFGSLKLFSILYWASLALFYVKFELAVLLSVFNTIFFIGHFLTYRHWLDFLFPKQESWNVEGVIEPQHEVRNTILIAGHIDSVREFQWWHHFGSKGLLLNTIAGFGYVFQGIVFLTWWVISFFSLLPSAFEISWWIFLVISPAALSMFFKHGKLVVDGALDNLTGVAIAVEMAKVFADYPLQNTRLKLISFGSEEPALRGAFAYARAHKSTLKDENAVLINFDTIKAPQYVTLLKGEINTFVKYPEALYQELKSAFDATKIPYHEAYSPLGATDGSAFAIEGLPAVSVVGLDTTQYDPCYHTRLDNLEHLDAKGLENVKTALIHFIKERDKRFSA